MFVMCSGGLQSCFTKHHLKIFSSFISIQFIQNLLIMVSILNLNAQAPPEENQEVYVRDIVEEATSANKLAIEVRTKPWQQNIFKIAKHLAKFFALLVFSSAILACSLYLFLFFLTVGERLRVVLITCAMIIASCYMCCLVFLLLPIFRVKSAIMASRQPEKGMC